MKNTNKQIIRRSVDQGIGGVPAAICGAAIRHKLSLNPQKYYTNFSAAPGHFNDEFDTYEVFFLDILAEIFQFLLSFEISRNPKSTTQTFWLRHGRLRHGRLNFIIKI